MPGHRVNIIIIYHYTVVFPSARFMPRPINMLTVQPVVIGSTARIDGEWGGRVQHLVVGV